MKTLIAYATKYGCTEKCAAMLKAKLNGEVELCNLKKMKDIDITPYGKVIIGGSVMIGKVHKEVSEFSNKELNQLKEKKIGLFICCMREEEIAEKELNESFPQELLSLAAVKEYFGGEFIFQKMNFMDRLIVKKVAKIEKDISNVSEEKINEFAQLMNEA